MGTTLFPFRLKYDGPDAYAEGLEAAIDVEASDGPTEYARSLHAEARFVAEGSVILDGDSGHAYSDWLAFYRAHAWGATSLLYAAQRKAHRVVTAEAAGTSTGAPGETFLLDRRFIDASTLVVKVGGVVQALTTDYTLTGNNTAPVVTTTASFDAGAVTFDYEYRHQVRCIVTGHSFMTRDPASGEGIHLVSVVLREVVAGGAMA